MESDSQSSTESLKQIDEYEYEWERCWNERRILHRNRSYSTDCECSNDEDDIFELEDLERRLRRLKKQLNDYLTQFKNSIDDYSNDNEGDYQYVSFEIIMDEESEYNSRLHEIRSLQKRINVLRRRISEQKHRRRPNSREERMHEARVILHQMRAGLCADEQEWQKLLDDLDDDIETDEQHVLSQQNHRNPLPAMYQDSTMTIQTVWLDTNGREHVQSSKRTPLFDSIVECEEHILSLCQPAQLTVSGEYNRDEKIIEIFHNTSQVGSTRKLDDNDETEQKQSPTSLLMLRRQRIVIIFLTSNSKDAEALMLSKQLNQTADSIIIFDNAVDCFDYIATTTNCVISVIVIDDYANDRKVLAKLNECPPVSIIYRRIGGQDQRPLIDEHELIDICPKLQGSFTERNPLCHRIRADLPITQDTFNVFNPNNMQRSVRDLKTEDVTFVWYQIMIDLIRSFPVTVETRADFLTECRKRYGVTDQQINGFESDYRSTDACKWYAKSSCWFEIVNEALRKQNIPMIHNLRLFINDLSTQILEEHDTDRHLITVYRGQLIGNEEIQTLQENVGGLIAFNTFLSTTGDKGVAEFFGPGTTQWDSEALSFLLIEIEATTDMCRNLIDDAVILDEKEYLFMIGTIFKIVSFEPKSPKFYYAKLCCPTNTDRTRLAVLKKHFERRILFGQGPINLTWGRFLYHIGDYDAAKEYYKRLLASLTDDQFELYITIQNDLAQIYFHQGLYIEANDFQRKALDRALASCVQLNMAILYENQGNILLKLNNYAHALDAYRRALDIENRRTQPKNENIARIYSNMGMVHNNLRQFTLALRCFCRAFRIQRRISLASSTDLAATCNNIGIVYTNIGEHKLAHKYYTTAFSIALRSLPYDHPSAQMYLKNRNAYITATPMHDNREPFFIEMLHSRRRDSDISVAQIEVILDPSTS